jgi:hypothetical protein
LRPEYLTTQVIGSNSTHGDSAAPGYLGSFVRFKDGSRWKLTSAFSHIKYQDGQSPFEAWQVFECIRIADPHKAHGDLQEAVVKVKYQ